MQKNVSQGCHNWVSLYMVFYCTDGHKTVSITVHLKLMHSRAIIYFQTQNMQNGE